MSDAVTTTLIRGAKCVVLIVAGLLLSATNALAQCQPPRWNGYRSPPGVIMTYGLSGFSSEQAEAIREGFRRWSESNVESGHYTIYEEVSHSEALFKVTAFPPANCLSCAGSISVSPANVYHGFILAAHIYINPDPTVNPTPAEYLQTTLHEVGHGQGLEHAVGDYPSVVQDGLPVGHPLLPAYPSDCDANGVYNYAITPPPGIPNGAPGGGIASCPPGGCIGNGSLACAPGMYYDRSTAWCIPFGEYVPYQFSGFNTKPIIDVTWPHPGSLFGSPFSGTVTSRMIDPDGRVWRVDYHVNGVPVFSTTQHPFNWSVSGVGPGVYNIEAVAYDNSNEYTISAIRTINICGPPQPPSLLWGSVGPGFASVAWTAVPGAYGYQVEAGTAYGATNVGVWGTGQTGMSGTLPAGTYYIRVRALHSVCGVGTPTTDLILTVP